MTDADQRKPVSLAVIILTYNEERHLPRAIESILSIASEIYVIDSLSTDATVEIARSYGAHVLQHPFEYQAKQFAWALANAPITTDWVMRLDADEVVETNLAEEILSRLPNLPAEITGVNLNRKTIFAGRFIRHGGRYPLLLLRVWRRGKAEVEDRWMDEHMCLLEGKTTTFRGGFADHNLFGLTAFTEKHNRYASREALEALNQRLHLFEGEKELSPRSASRQAMVKRFLKQEIYNKIPYEASSLLYLVYRYIFCLGFLDGREGFAYHVLQGFWYRFLVGAKLQELNAATRNVLNREELRSEILRITRQQIKT